MKKENLAWIEPQQITVPGEISEFFPEYPVISRVLAQRGITTAETLQPFLYPEAYQPLSPFKFPGVSKAVELVQEAISRHQMIGVWGDFDVDGQTATAILVGSLRQLGARVTYHIPVRGKESHGITIPYLKEFLAQGINLLLTCDTGITAYEAVQFATQQGVKVVITDHHSLESTLPDADCIVHPHLLENGHPARTLCGAGAALELAAGLLDDPQFKNNAGLYLDLAAIGTIADLAALKGDNRFFVQLGLQRIRKDPKPLLQAVFEIAELDHSQVTENQISFHVAPRLNALGRLSDANRAVEMLLSTNLDECREFINQVETMNIKRKLITEQVFQAACAQVDADPDLREKPVIIASHSEWPGGVIGIVASRLVEVYQKPAIVVSTPAGEVVRGSARSIEGLDITASLKKAADLLITCGGHPMAAGFSLLAENFEEFKSAINRIIAQTVAVAPLEQALTIDAFITLPEINLELAEALEKLAPFGPGNPPVTFASRGLTILKKAPLGRDSEHIQLTLADPSGFSMRAIRWQAVSLEMPKGYFDLAYSLQISNYKGQREPQINWMNTRPAEIQGLQDGAQAAIKVLDYRKDFNAGLQWLLAHQTEQMITWSEGLAAKTLPGKGRMQLSPAKVLVIAGNPPGRAELDAAVKTVLPETIILFGLKTAHEDPKEFLKQLLGLVLFAYNRKSGRFTLEDALHATGQSAEVVMAGLQWVSHQGEFSITEIENGKYLVTAPGQRDPSIAISLQNRLALLLEEAAAFRAYYLRILPDFLFDGIIHVQNKDIKHEE